MEAMPKAGGTRTLTLLALTLALLIVGWGRVRREPYAQEALDRVAVARDLTAATGDRRRSQARGHEGLVGSLFQAPLPTLAIVVLAVLPGVSHSALVLSLIAAVSLALCASYISASWGRVAVPFWLRAPAVLLVMLWPPLVRAVWSADVQVIFLSLIVCGICGLVEWLRTRRLRDLAVAGLLLGLAIGTRYQAGVVAAAGLVAVTIATSLERRGWHRVEGTVITYALPACYTCLLWLAGNWLVLGDPLFFLREMSGYLTLGLTTPALSFGRGCHWGLIANVLTFALSVPLVVAAFADTERRRLAGRLAAGTAVGAACLLLILPGSAVAARTDPLQGTPGTPIRMVVSELQRDDTLANATFIVSGYAGYAFVQAAGAGSEDRWVHVYHLDEAALQRALADYPGRDVKVLVNRLDLGEQTVGIEWRGERSRIPERFQFERRSGKWIVFDVLERPATADATLP
jgi:hypothetical protein